MAAWYAVRGFEALGQRLRTARGEIDLIVADAAMVVFVEVKARRRADQAAYAVTPRQQIRLAGAAEIALADHADWCRDATRFDVVLVVGDVITVIPDAFRPGDLQQT